MAAPTFHDGLENDSEAFMEFGETLVYLPRTGAARSITGIINRRPPEPSYGTPLQGQPVLTIRVRNSTTYGIATSEYDNGGDRVRLALRRGGTETDYRIVGEPDLQNAGCVLYTLR
jgi:hypothetical protein